MTTIGVENVSFAYNGQTVLAGITLDVRAGELLALVGPNGSGKTTLLRAISGVLAPKTGVIYLDFSGRESQLLSSLAPSELARSLAAVEQEIHVAFDFTVRETVSLGRLPHMHRLRPFSPTDRDAVARAVEQVGIAPFAERSVQALSSGERQRVFLAMALAQEPKVLLLDEPTAHLDLKYQIEMMEIVRRLVAQGLTVIAVLHDLNLAARYAHRVAVLSSGSLAALGSPTDVLTPELIERVFGVQVRVLHSEQDEIYLVPQP